MGSGEMGGGEIGGGESTAARSAAGSATVRSTARSAVRSTVARAGREGRDFGARPLGVGVWRHPWGRGRAHLVVRGAAAVVAAVMAIQ